MRPIPFATQTYRARSLPLSAQRLVNLYPEAGPSDAPTRVDLIGTPGATTFANVGSGPVYGMHAMGGVPYVVSGTNVYTLASDGTATDLGSIGATDKVVMDDNGTQVAIASGGDGYIATSASVSKITDPDFPGGSSVTFMDQYFIWTKPGSAQFNISALADGMAYDALDFATAEGKPDDLVAGYADHRNLWLIGEESIEIWWDSGASNFPFERYGQAFIEQGCAAKSSVVSMDNTIFWLGDNLIVYRADGFTPMRISTYAIENAIRSYSTTADAHAFSYVDDGHTFYVLTFPAGSTFVYDAATKQWHERSTGDLGRWGVCGYVRAYGKHLVGDSEDGKVYSLDLAAADWAGDTIKQEAAGPHIGDGVTWRTMSRFQLDMEAGVGLTTGQGSDPQIMLDWSDDGGRTWSNELWRSMGKIGDYRHQAVWNRLGRFRRRVLRVRKSDPVKASFLSAFAEIR